MSGYTPSCEVRREFLYVADQSKTKAKAHPRLEGAYLQVELEMRRALNRHTPTCPLCQAPGKVVVQ